MLRLTPPVAVATGSSRTRPARSRPQPRRTTRRARAPRPEALRPSDLGLGQLFMHTREAVVVGNTETGRIALWNPAAEQLFGYTPDEALGQPIEMLMPAPIARLHTEGLAQYRRTGHGGLLVSGAPIEVPALMRDGTEVRVELSLTPIDYTPAPRRYVMALVRDVSDRKRADLAGLEAARQEAARTELRQALEAREALLADATREIRRRVARLRRATRRLRNGGAPGRIAGPGEGLAGTESAQHGTSTSDAPATERAEPTERLEPGGVERAESATHADQGASMGAQSNRRAESTVDRSNASQPSETAESAMQAGHSVRAGAQSNRPGESLAARHNVGQPSDSAADSVQRAGTGVRAAAQNGEDTPRGNARDELLARLIDGRVEALERALERLDDTAAIQSGHFEVSTDKVNLVPLLTSIVGAAQAGRSLHHVRLGAPQGLTAAVDPARIEQLVSLVLHDAFRRNPRGCWVDLQLRRPLAGLARLEIRDYGRKVSDTRRARLLDPSAPECWLAVCRHIVARHGGTLELEFPDEGGVRVVVTLPTQHGRIPGSGLS